MNRTSSIVIALLLVFFLSSCTQRSHIPPNIPLQSTYPLFEPPFSSSLELFDSSSINISLFVKTSGLYHLAIVPNTDYPLSSYHAHFSVDIKDSSQHCIMSKEMHLGDFLSSPSPNITQQDIEQMTLSIPMPQDTDMWDVDYHEGWAYFIHAQVYSHYRSCTKSSIFKLKGGHIYTVQVKVHDTNNSAGLAAKVLLTRTKA